MNELKLQPVSVTRKMAASLPKLRALAESKGLKIHHLGAGYPHPEVTDPKGYLKQKEAYFQKLAADEGLNDPGATPDFLRQAYAYTDTLGPLTPRQAFAAVYGADWGIDIDPSDLVPSVGATGGISRVCSLFERPGNELAYITDAPTYAGFLARASLNQKAHIFSVEMDSEGPLPDRFLQQIRAARHAGYQVPLYYTVPDGHNPAGISFSQSRREEILEIAIEEDVLILEDAPYIYISFVETSIRPKPFLAMDPGQTIHLFTGSKIGLPGPRVGFVYSQAEVEISGGTKVPLTDLLLTEASSDILFQNPEALRGFEALLHDEQLNLRESLWPVAETKLAVYRENRRILLDTLETELGSHRDLFDWTIPDAGFFCVFSFLKGDIRTDEAFTNQLVSDYGVVVIPMYDFYPLDARQRDRNAGLNQLRLSFCFTESVPGQRAEDMREAVQTFCVAVKHLSGLA